MRTGCVSVAKGTFEPGCINEDSVICKSNLIAVSDGAGGGGLFAERWSRYLLDHLSDAPFADADALDQWIESIWEPYYTQCEEDAKLLGGLSLDKFYDEGSFATLIAVWKLSDNECRWISFGDSVAFHYNLRTHILEHSFGALSDFDRPPYLINCKDELKKEGFKSGVFQTDKDSIVFVASDALSHYIMMLYEVSKKGEFEQELTHVLKQQSKNENYVKMALNCKKIKFEQEVITKLCNCIGNAHNLAKHIQKLLKNGLIALDDYSFAVMK